MTTESAVVIDCEASILVKVRLVCLNATTVVTVGALAQPSLVPLVLCAADLLVAPMCCHQHHLRAGFLFPSKGVDLPRLSVACTIQMSVAHAATTCLEFFGLMVFLACMYALCLQSCSAAVAGVLI